MSEEFKVKHESVTPELAARFADELEVMIGQVMNGKRKADRLPVEHMIGLIQFSRCASPSPASDAELPPLPEPEYCADDLSDIFTAAQMHAYARAALQARWCAEVNADGLREEIAELRARAPSTRTASDTRTAAGEAECDAALVRAAPASQHDAALAALKPFADSYAPEAARMAKFYTPEDVARYGAQWDANTITPPATMGDFRRAYDAYRTASTDAATRPNVATLVSGDTPMEVRDCVFTDTTRPAEVDVEAERPRFEAWATANGFKIERREDAESPDTYFRYETEQRWIVWLAARTQADAGKADIERLDWLTEELADTVYMGDGRIIDIGGSKRPHDVRAAIDAARAKATTKPENT